MKIKNQSGVSLLEVLISVLILSVGLLGLGGLQLFALKSSNDAHFRTIASFIASDLSDRIRINPEGVAFGGYAISESQSVSLCGSSPPKQCETATPCTSAELASFDLHQIACGVNENGNSSLGMKNLLPSATLSVGCGTMTCGSNVEHTITLKWTETDNYDGDTQGQVKTLVWNIQP
ncbi:MAG: type IV pilus modification protein PilV [Cocleimonas sp.]|nr:type IV pilus modification protein PilV [Cocleimonas sp.]